MNNIEKIESFKTTDGTIFEKIEDAKSHQAYLHLETSWGVSNLRCMSRNSVDLKLAVEWLTENREHILNFLGEQKPLIKTGDFMWFRRESGDVDLFTGINRIPKDPAFKKYVEVY